MEIRRVGEIIRPEFTEEIVKLARSLPPSEPEIDWEERALAAEAEVERLQRQISDEADWQRELSYRE